MRRMSCVVAPSVYIAELIGKAYPSYVPHPIHYGFDAAIFEEQALVAKTNNFFDRFTMRKTQEL